MDGRSIILSRVTLTYDQRDTEYCQYNERSRADNDQSSFTNPHCAYIYMEGRGGERERGEKRERERQTDRQRQRERQRERQGERE